MIQKCNCSSDIIGKSPSFENVDFCDKNETNNECMERFQEVYYNSESLYCRNECPLECDSIKYDIKSYVNSYPSQYYAKFIKKWMANKNLRLSDNDYDKSFVRLRIGYESMEYSITEQKISITLNQLIANIGCYLGLCIGVTILSAFEVMELIFDLIMLPIRKRKLSEKKKLVK